MSARVLVEVNEWRVIQSCWLIWMLLFVSYRVSAEEEQDEDEDEDEDEEEDGGDCEEVSSSL